LSFERQHDPVVVGGRKQADDKQEVGREREEVRSQGSEATGVGTEWEAGAPRRRDFLSLPTPT